MEIGDAVPGTPVVDVDGLLGFVIRRYPEDGTVSVITDTGFGDGVLPYVYDADHLRVAKYKRDFAIDPALLAQMTRAIAALTDHDSEPSMDLSRVQHEYDWAASR